MVEWWIRLLDLPWEALQLMRAGGKIILPIAALSLVMWFLIVRKLAELRAATRERLLYEQYTRARADRPPQPPQGWLAQLLKEFEARRSCEDKADKKLLFTLLKKKSYDIQRSVPTILVLASIAPLLGLLGTVTGMISTFDAISQVGTGNPRPLASGISEALITTQCGLAVAIPGLIVGSYLNRRVERFQARLDELGLRLYRRYQHAPVLGRQVPGEVR